MTAAQLLELYAKSWFEAFVPAERIITPREKDAAVAEYEHDPVRALMENVEEARDAIEGTRDRFLRARRDGLFDEQTYRSATKKEKKALAEAMDRIRGDYVRAQSELAHWREYIRWATEEQAAKVAKLEAAEPDRRLPPEAP